MAGLRRSANGDLTITHPILALPMDIGGRNIFTTESSLEWGLGTVGAIAMAGAIVTSPGITVGMAASTATADGVTATSMVTGVRTTNVVNGMRAAEAGSANAVAGTVDVVAVDTDVDTNMGATVAIAATIATN